MSSCRATNAKQAPLHRYRLVNVLRLGEEARRFSSPIPGDLTEERAREEADRAAKQLIKECHRFAPCVVSMTLVRLGVDPEEWSWEREWEITPTQPETDGEPRGGGR